MWLEELVKKLRAAGASSSELPPAFSAAARRLGRDALGEGASIAAGADELPLTSFTLDMAGRVALLAALSEGNPALFEPTLELVYRSGDTREKAAVVRTLSLLPEAERFVWIALDAGRTNDTDLFSALSVDNPFPARHYAELEFNKLVMKAAFVRAPVDRIIGLERRKNPELSRMAMEHIDEQESAKRSFVPELWLAIAALPPPGAVGRMLGYLSHAVAEQRLGAARGLELAAQPRTRSFLSERIEVERDEAVRAVLLRALAAIPSEEPER